jgi:hypothetical protein
MIIKFDNISEIVGIPCDDCGSGGFVILDVHGNIERMGCDCVGVEDEYFPFDEFGECD